MRVNKYLVNFNPFSFECQTSTAKSNIYFLPSRNKGADKKIAGKEKVPGEKNPILW
jgi:hypothetical protein